MGEDVSGVSNRVELVEEAVEEASPSLGGVTPNPISAQKEASSSTAEEDAGCSG